MVNLNTNRIAHTPTGNQNVASLDDIVNVASQSKADSQIRAKSDGLGGVVVYGHKGGFRSLFNKSNPHRQDAGTLEVKKSLEHYVQGKNPQTQEVARQFLSRFVSKGGEVTANITNQDILSLKQKLDEAENATVGLGVINQALKRDPSNFLLAVTPRLSSIADGIELANMRHYRPQSGDKFDNIAFPEINAGLALGVLKKLGDGGDLLPSDRKLLMDLHRNDSQARGNNLNQLFNRYDESGNREALIGGLADAIKNRFFAEQSCGSVDFDNHPELPRQNDIRAPVYLHDEAARNHLAGFSGANANEKLDKLVNAYERHLEAPPERLHGNNIGQQMGVVRHAPTNGQALALSFDKFLDVVGLKG
ncbi:hypothetical protein [Prosthecodimorpha hirschii]|uniref:hypothetical protein n=1 Tax=Prosthecodimorpha hirschii TaxID=665126 RepID=UPI00112A7C6E|nr:hypothetical protein [Prosthecomicrobium hirschii]